MPLSLNLLRIETKNAILKFNPEEAEILTRYVLEDIAGINKLDIFLTPEKVVSDEIYNNVTQAILRLGKNEPIQYITQKAYFDGHIFYVNPHVLIPRPETEELVYQVFSENKKTALKVADICCGSGCIGIALQKRNPTWKLYLTDVSPRALQVTKINTENIIGKINNIYITAADFLHSDPFPAMGQLDILCCNPPYIPVTSSHLVNENVSKYEPHIALFEPSNKRAAFYTRLAEYAREKLKPNGIIYAEIHVDAATIVSEIFVQYGFNVRIIKDINQHDRILVANWI